MECLLSCESVKIDLFVNGGVPHLATGVAPRVAKDRAKSPGGLASEVPAVLAALTRDGNKCHLSA